MALPKRSGRFQALPKNAEEKMNRSTVRGALHVPRTRDACDLWIGGCCGSGARWGRGLFEWTVNGRRYAQPAAAVAYRLARLGGAPLPRGMQINHTCDVESCVNPDHVYLGTAKMGGSDLHRRDSALEQGVARLAVLAHIGLYTNGLRKWAAWLERACKLLKIDVVPA